MVNKKAVIIVTIIALIVIGGIVYINVKRIDTSTPTLEIPEAEEQEMNVNVEEAESEEEVKKVEEEINQTKQENEASEEKALELVKQEWGEDDTVYYTVDNNNGTTYNISVRDKTTTETLAEYKVNLNTNSVEIQ